MGATEFWKNLISATKRGADVANVDPAAAAKKYGIPEAWAREWLDRWESRNRAND